MRKPIILGFLILSLLSTFQSAQACGTGGLGWVPRRSSPPRKLAPQRLKAATLLHAMVFASPTLNQEALADQLKWLSSFGRCVQPSRLLVTAACRLVQRIPLHPFSNAIPADGQAQVHDNPSPSVSRIVVSYRDKRR